MARNNGLTLRKSGAPRPDVYRAPHSPQRDLHRRLRVARSGPSRHIPGTELPRGVRTGLGRPRRAQRQAAQTAAPPVHLLRLHPVWLLRLLHGRRVPAGPARPRPVRLLPLHRPSRSLSGALHPRGAGRRAVHRAAPPPPLRSVGPRLDHFSSPPEPSGRAARPRAGHLPPPGRVPPDPAPPRRDVRGQARRSDHIGLLRATGGTAHGARLPMPFIAGAAVLAGEAAVGTNPKGRHVASC